MENYDLETLKVHLPEYLATITQHRKGKQYNCPFCGSGTGKNGTPARTALRLLAPMRTIPNGNASRAEQEGTSSICST